MSDIVDLTISDSDEEARRRAKRRRRDESDDLDVIYFAGDNDSDDVVLIEPSKRGQQTRQQEQRQQQTLGEDEDLAVVGERGEVWNKTLPHSRDLCGEQPFTKQRSLENKAHCNKCYCFICDVPADQCDEWGEGSSYADHCNAHGDSDFFAQIKKRRKDAAQRGIQHDALRIAHEATLAAAAALGIGSNDPLYEQLERSMAVRGEGRSSGGGGRDIKPGKPALPPPCSLTRIPDPAGDRDLMLLARIEVGVEASESHTIAALRKRLVPTGFFASPDATETAGDKLYLGNLFESDWNMATSKYVPTYLRLRQLPLHEQAPAPAPTRTRQVTILHYDGRAKPMTYGVEVAKEAAVKEIMKAATPLAGLDKKGECFVAMDLSAGLLHATFLSASHKVTDGDKALRLALWRVPKPSDSGSGAPKYAIIFHRKPSGVDYPQYEGVGLPTLVPLGRTLANGGKTAERAVLEQVLDALTPLRRNVHNAPPPAQAAKDMIAAGTHLHRTSPYSAMFNMIDDTSQFATVWQYNNRTRYGESFFREGRIYLHLDWTPAQLAAYDTAAWAKPAVDDSASPAAMAPTLALIKAHDEWALKTSHAKQLPYTMLEELKAAVRCCEPAKEYPMYFNRVGLEPMARVVLDLVPDSEQAGEKRGKAVFTVYVWKGDRGVAHRQFFRAHDAWDSGRSARHNFTELGTHPLKATMEVLLWGSEEHKRMRQRIREWSDKERSCERSIPGLMKALERGEMPAAVQPAGLTVTMRPYQLQSLQFMLDCERGEKGFRRLFWERVQTPEGTSYWWSTLLGRASREVPEQPWGGWCAEEMGLGKTIEVLGLILANPAPPLPSEGRQQDGSHRTPCGLIKSRATLVVCAVSLVGQWIAEAEAKLGGSLRLHMYHGQTRIRDPVRLATQFDLVVTTYATLSTDFGGKRGNLASNFPPLGAIKWHRLVLDEAHTVKNAAAGHSKACMALKADRRWMCTGTPVNTDIGDLYGQFVVLGVAPFNNKTFFDANIKSAFGNNIFTGNCPALMYALGQTMVRHTKKQVLGGEEVLQLPPKTEETVAVVLTESEQAMYRKAHAASAALFAQYRALGPASINKHLLQIMALLLPMRRVCSGGNLKRRDLEVNDPLFGEGAGLRRRRLSGGGGLAGGLAPTDHTLVAPEEECPICIDVLEQPAVTPCNHWFCRECILGVLAANPKCPMCRRDLTMGHLRNGITAAEADAEEAAAEAKGKAAAAAAPAGEKGKGAAEGGDGEGQQAEGEEEAAAPAEPVHVSESKLVALLKQLRSMRRADPTAKALIFSQYVSTIEWLKVRLTQAGFGYRFISGSMPLKQRAKAIHAFQQDPPTTVFLLSMRSGSVGINLTAASHVFLMEPALNPALEEQAIGRAWRMGQQRSVKVIKFYVKGSVEERIMEVVKQRTEAVAGIGTGGAGGAAAGGAGDDSSEDDEAGVRRRRLPRTNVRMQDLVGSITADRQQLRVGELEVLFQEPEFPEPRVPEHESEDDEEEAAAAAAAFAAAAADRPGTSRAHAALGANGSLPRRGRGRLPRAVATAAAAALTAAAEEEEVLGRGARRAARQGRQINYSKLGNGTSEDEEGGENEETMASPQQQRHQYQQQEEQQQEQQQEQQKRGGRSRKRRRRFGESGSDSEWEAPQDEEEADSMSDSDEEEGEEEVESEEEDSGWRCHTFNRSKGSVGRAAAAAPRPTALHQPAPAVQKSGEGAAGDTADADGNRQQAQPAARTSNIRNITFTHIPAALPGSSTSGRLSTGEPAAVPASTAAAAKAPAAAAATAPPSAAAAAGAGGKQGTPRTVMRGPKRGHRVAALMAHHTAASAGPTAEAGQQQSPPAS